MAKVQISKNLINSIASQNNEIYLERTQNLVRSVVSASVEELAEKVSYVTKNNVVLQPVNELLSGAFCDNSQFVYFLGIENAQLELNTAKKTNFWRELWQRFKLAWQNRRKRRKKKKKKDDKVEVDNSKPQDMSKYSIYDLGVDFQKAVSNQLSATSLIYLNGNEILILGKEDFGANTKIKIYLVNSNESLFRYYAGKRKGFIDIDLNARCEALNTKIKNAGENFIKILKIFNVLFYNANNRLPNQVYMESVLCSVPDELFEGEDIYKAFVKVVNYLSIKTIKNTPSINNPEKTIFTDSVCGEETYGFTRMMEFISNNQ